MNDKKQLIVEAIANGTVIDHIPAGQGVNILHHFQLDKLGKRITVGFNLITHQGTYKDLIKIEDVRFSPEEANRLALLAPSATVNVIEDYTVVQKMRLSLPETIVGLFRCPNQNCASHNEPVISRFTVKSSAESTKLKCHYCEKTYPSEWVVGS